MNFAPTRDLSIALIGSGGDGVIATGEMLVQAAAREGIHAMLVKMFGPQIRGGESCARVRICVDPVHSTGDEVDVLVVFSWSDYFRFTDEIELKPGLIILHDETQIPKNTPTLPIHDKRLKPNVMHVPFAELAVASAGNAIAKNMVTLGALAQLVNIPFGGLLQSVEKKFHRKGEAVISSNQAALNKGREFIESLSPGFPVPQLEETHRPSRMVITGNDALACGAFSAGCRFYAGYPITPSSEVMEWLAKELPRAEGVMIQTEDEISAINMVIGASHAGKKAMTATSGPGLSLMQEAIGLASISETPAVIMDVQRVGPSTGIPTKSEQSDLNAAIYGSHGDAAKVVLAPTDSHNAFFVARRAFEISERYQLPVIVLSDQYIGQRLETIEPIAGDLSPVEARVNPELDPNGDYKRFANTQDGISPVAPLGLMGGEYLASGIEHDEHGHPTSSYSLHQEMNEKRYKKFESIVQEYGIVYRHGSQSATIGMLGWGSTQGVLIEAIELLAQEKLEVSALVPELIYPLPIEAIDQYLAHVDYALVFELSYSAQFYHLLRSEVAEPDKLICCARSGAKLLSRHEIADDVRKHQLALNQRKQEPVSA